MKRLICTLASLTPTLAFAFFCPNNFSQIEVGDTIDRVTQVCGKPDSQKETKKANDNVPQEWDYYIPQTVQLNTTQGGVGTLKTSITFDSTGKAINISVNGLGVGASTICGNSIALGDTKDAVKAACGEASFISKQPPPDAANGKPAPETIVTVFTYNGNPPGKLTFENGKLVGQGTPQESNP